MNTENPETPDEEQVSKEFVAEFIGADSESTEADGQDPAEAQAADAAAPTEEQDGDAADVAEVAAADMAPDSPSNPSVVYAPTVLVPVRPTAAKPPPSPFEHLAAKGGAIGAIVLGVLSFAGSFITSYAILNSFMGVLLGLWGLRSNHQKMAMLGMLLCLISAFFCVVEISEWIQKIWPQEEF